MRILFFAFLILSPLATQASSPADSVQQCAVFDYAQWRRDHPRPAGKPLANLNVGAPRTVRMIYFLPNDRPYNAEAVDTMKTRIRQAQDFFGKQMEAHGLGNLTFRFETDARSEPLVHLVNGQHSTRDYAYDRLSSREVFREVDRAFDIEANVYYIAIDNGDLGGWGVGLRMTKDGGYGLVSTRASFATVAHELGHAFGLWHDFRDDEYIMSYGRGGLGRNSLSMCNAEFLAVHPYFNSNSPIKGKSSPAIAERTASPIRIAGATSIPVRIRARDPDGLHQAILFTIGFKSYEVKACRGLEGKRDAVVEFDYDGVVPSEEGSDFSSFQTQRLRIEVIDALGNVADSGGFRLFRSPFGRSGAATTLTKVSGDGQEWLVGAQLAQPLVVSVLDQYGSALAGAVVTFSVATGGGTLSATSATTDANGRARSTLTLGRELGTNTVEATVAETPFATVRPVTFTATAIRQIPHSLTKVSGDGQEWLAGTQLARPFVVSVLDQDGATMAGVIVRFSVATGGGTLSATSATTDANGRARSTLTLGRELGTNTVEATVAETPFVTVRPATFIATASGQMPHTLTKVAGDGQEGPASTQLAQPLVVSILDQEGSALAGAVVRFSVTAGAGMLSATDANPCTVGAATSSTTVTTNANGQAAIRLTLGREPGANAVAVTVAGLEQATFTAAAAEPAKPHRLTKVCGDNQEGPVITQLTQPLVVSVVDENGSALAGAVVAFSVTAGEGTLSSPTATTDANGRAASWLTLGREPGTNTVEATVEGLNPVTFAATGQESLFSMFLSGQLGTLPNRTHLLQNAPNPFNSETMLSYFLHTPGPVRLEVFTLAGQRVAVLHQGSQSAGYHRLSWDSRDAAGQPVASGLYLYRLVTAEDVLTRKLILLR